MTFLGILAVLGRILPTPRQAWAFLTSPPGLCMLVALAIGAAFVGGEIHATNRERAACQARIDASVRAAQDFDRKLSEEQQAKAAQQQQEANARMAAAEQKASDYEEKFKSCEIGDRGADFLNGTDIVPPPGRVLPHAPKPPRRP